MIDANSPNPKHVIKLEYCAPCNYLNLAMTAASAILGQWGPTISNFELAPSAWGTFELTIDGELVFSKWALGRHPREGELQGILVGKLGEPLVDWEDHGPERVDTQGFTIH
jgi:selenoprotein W-related protein